jgi:hypothetical protein
MQEEEEKDKSFMSTERLGFTYVASDDAASQKLGFSTCIQT